ncbi:hypothetical protein [Candidatus Cyanaurora vandensis]|uniref:hypothetical protein n=1 Tax=Candidatus Cyanaurora vandensis TaxID=2714958 RepID=UPI002579B7E2|nr:hypothetical protein [Candidatus Cyanaurora vandensis]
MPNLTIDCLTLKLSGLSTQEGQRLAQLLEARLVSVPSIASSPDLDHLSITLNAPPGQPLEWLAQQIVAEIVRRVGRTLN